ncbi:hypothetical protein A1O7_00719 [Cladophialophora yegresii CBS 114405]|uniref:Protein YAE1 n=1 Tax=Cladophialophora yegresii CBS 114405 TaxID=1182544 RepID=W9W8X4_9EURO|nr:uncharacterized protein A1O7_00719 [Cladophialophora yegresii CBS 114405]EXJ64383.1 hypothetical protein A1O7_00719 [Cladophialophora yegresii CBS 114405]
MEDTPPLDRTTTTAESLRSPKSSPSPDAPSSPDTTITEPEQSPGADDDIWDTSSDHFPLGAGAQYPDHDLDTHPPDDDSHPRFARGAILSDLPALRRQHMTDGYREGLSVGKARVMQSGFDAGYPLGVEVGLRAGNVLGVLEGVIAALTSSKAGAGSARIARTSKASTDGGQNSTATEITSAFASGKGGLETMTGSTREVGNNGARNREELRFVRALYARAQEELKISELLKGLGDDKIAAIPDAVASKHEKNSPADGKAENEPSLPKEIEDALRKWERLVLGALEQRHSPDGSDSAALVTSAGKEAT